MGGMPQEVKFGLDSMICGSSHILRGKCEERRWGKVLGELEEEEESMPAIQLK